MLTCHHSFNFILKIKCNKVALFIQAYTNDDDDYDGGNDNDDDRTYMQQDLIYLP